MGIISERYYPAKNQPPARKTQVKTKGSRGKIHKRKGEGSKGAFGTLQDVLSKKINYQLFNRVIHEPFGQKHKNSKGPIIHLILYQSNGSNRVNLQSLLKRWPTYLRKW